MCLITGLCASQIYWATLTPTLVLVSPAVHKLGFDKLHKKCEIATPFSTLGCQIPLSFLWCANPHYTPAGALIWTVKRLIRFWPQVGYSGALIYYDGALRPWDSCRGTFCEIPTQNKKFAKRSGWYVQWKGASFCDCSMLVREGGLWQQTTEGVRSHHPIVATVAMLLSCVELPKYIYILNSPQIARLVEFLSCTDMLTRSPHNIKLKLNACSIPWSKLIE